MENYRFTKNVAPFSGGLATFLASFSFSQQDDFSVQAVWALLPHAAFSEQPVLALVVTLAMSALAAFFDDLPSPACVNAIEARQANVKQAMNFFIGVGLLFY